MGGEVGIYSETDDDDDNSLMGVGYFFGAVGAGVGFLEGGYIFMAMGGEAAFAGSTIPQPQSSSGELLGASFGMSHSCRASLKVYERWKCSLGAS